MDKEEKELLSYINGGYKYDKIHSDLSIFNPNMHSWFESEVKSLLKNYYSNGCIQDLKIIKKYIQIYMKFCLYRGKYDKLCNSLDTIKRSINEIEYTSD